MSIVFLSDVWWHVINGTTSVLCYGLRAVKLWSVCCCLLLCAVDSCSVNVLCEAWCIVMLSYVCVVYCYHNCCMLM